MNYTDKQFDALVPYEDNFRTAVEGEWTRRIPVEGQTLIRKIYEDATATRVPFNAGCANCLINLLRRAGRLYFADKKDRDANKTALANVAHAAQQQAAPKKPLEPAKPAAESAPAPQAKKPSNHHRNRSKSAKK